MSVIAKQFCCAKPVQNQNAVLSTLQVSRYCLQQLKCVCYRKTILLRKARAKPKRSSVYSTGEQILPSGISGCNFNQCRPTLNSLDLFHDTMCVQAHLNVYFSGGQMLAAMAQQFTTIRPPGTWHQICNISII